MVQLIRVLLYTVCPPECIRYIPSFEPMMVLLNTVTFGPVPCLTSIPWFTALVTVLFAIILLADPKFINPVVYWSWMLLFAITAFLLYCKKIPHDDPFTSQLVIVMFLLDS